MKRTVLVVDDNPVDRERVRRALDRVAAETGLDLEVRECPDGVSALRELEARPPDLLVTDLSMPGGVTGYDLEREGRERGVQVEVMSGLPPLAPYWAGRTRSKDHLGWLRDAVILQGRRQGQARATGPLRRALMDGGGALVVVLCALLSGWV